MRSKSDISTCSNTEALLRMHIYPSSIIGTAQPKNDCPQIRPWPIMPKILPIMLLSIAQNVSLLCSKLCVQNQDYVLKLTVY